MKKYLSMFAVAVLVAFVFTGCGQATQSEIGDGSAEASISSPKQEVNSDRATESTPDYKEDTSQTYEISTKYCTLQYPEKWQDRVEVSTSEDETYTVKFSATVDDVTFSLFDICFGDVQGYTLGEINDNGQAVSVSVVTYDLNLPDDMEQETQMDLLAMQEDVNTVIQSLEQYHGFVPAA